MSTKHELHSAAVAFVTRTAILVWAALAVLGAAPAAAQSEPSITVVSAANFEGRVAPDSLATVFGENFAEATASATLDAEGRLPTTLSNTTVEVNGTLAALIFVSPTQINFVVPPDVDLGQATVEVHTSAGATLMTEVSVDLTAPGLFSLFCLRDEQGAVLNGVSFEFESFQVVTAENHGDDNRTRLALFGTGLRFAGSADREAGINVSESVRVEAVNQAGQVTELDVEYAGEAGAFFGLDQINVVLSPSLDGNGMVKLRVRVGARASNEVSIIVSPRTVPEVSAESSLSLHTVAGTGEGGFSGDGSAALEAQLQSPAAVEFDGQGNLYIADKENHVVRVVSSAGVMTRFAGTGEAGFSGDGGAAVEAQLRSPVDLAVDAEGSVYVADETDHRVRKIDANGTITTVAGTGVAGFSGDFGAATQAQLSSPSSVAVNSNGSLLVADRSNHRIRKVTADGMIQTIAGTGQAGFSGDGRSALQAQLDSPISIAVNSEGTIYIADGGNHRIRRISVDGRISTLAGTGEEGVSGAGALAAEAEFGSPVYVAIDGSGKLLLSDSSSQRIRLIDSDCTIDTIAGTGNQGFSADVDSAGNADLNMPMGLTVDGVGNIYFASSGSHRVRRLSVSAGARCGQAASVAFDPPVARAGQTLTGTLRLNCAVESDTQVMLSSSGPALVPPAVTVAAGQTTARFQIDTSADAQASVQTVTAIGGGASISGLFRVAASTEDSISLGLSSHSVEAGAAATGIVRLGVPAGPGGTVVNIDTDIAAGVVVPSITVPEGQTSAEFLVATETVASIEAGVVTVSTGSATAEAELQILAAEEARTEVMIESLTLSSIEVEGGETLTGRITLSESVAAEGGAQIMLSSDSPFVSVPASVIVDQGTAMAEFEVVTQVIASLTAATITAHSANMATAELALTPVSTSLATLDRLELSTGAVTAGESLVGTVVLEEPAAAGGVLVDLTSAGAFVIVPPSITVPEGSTEASFTIDTLTVLSLFDAVIWASSENMVSATVSLLP